MKVKHNILFQDEKYGIMQLDDLNFVTVDMKQLEKGGRIQRAIIGYYGSLAQAIVGLSTIITPESILRRTNPVPNEVKMDLGMFTKEYILTQMVTLLYILKSMSEKDVKVDDEAVINYWLDNDAVIKQEG